MVKSGKPTPAEWRRQLLEELLALGPFLTEDATAAPPATETDAGAPPQPTSERQPADDKAGSPHLLPEPPGLDTAIPLLDDLVHAPAGVRAHRSAGESVLDDPATIMQPSLSAEAVEQRSAELADELIAALLSVWNQTYDSAPDEDVLELFRTKLRQVVSGWQSDA